MPVPAASGTMRVIGFTGQVCAPAGSAENDSSAASASGNARSRGILSSGSLFDHEIELQRLVRIDRGVLDAATRGLAVAAHRVETVAEDAGSESMALTRHRGQHQPAVQARVEGLDRLERREETLVLTFAAGGDDILVLVDAEAHGAARGRHARACGPEVGGGVVHFEEVDVVAGAGDEGRADPAAGDVDLVA